VDQAGEIARVLLAAVAADGDRVPILTLAPDHDERDLLHLAVPDALVDRLVSVVDLGAKTRFPQCCRERLGSLPMRGRDREDADLNWRHEERQVAPGV